MSDFLQNQEKNPLMFLTGGGEMGEYIRDFDWSKTVLGPITNWPQCLCNAVSLCLNAGLPSFIWWGNSDLTPFYNDASRLLLGNMEPFTWLGRSGQDCWKGMWPTIGPILKKVFATGEASQTESVMWTLGSKFPQEELYITFSFSAIRDDHGKVGGVFCTCNDTTDKVVGERRLCILRELVLHAISEIKSMEDTCQTIARILANHPKDIPFSLQYLLQDGGKCASLVATSGIEPGTWFSPHRVDFSNAQMEPWPFDQVIESGCCMVVSELIALGSSWPEPTSQALILPILKPGQSQFIGFMVVGVNSSRPLDDDYRVFFDLLVNQAAIAIANSQAYEQEYRRVNASIELDRVKMAFFSNISHEFRTPLTLMLGPIEEMLNGVSGKEMLPLLDMVYRNGLRLQRLVNTFLDFSRIEAGRVQACFEPTDISAFTEELASSFRLACERAGLQLQIDCSPFDQFIFLDKHMWEKIVFNLLSNAFKFTIKGQITVSIRQLPFAAELRVRDTGTGIVKEEIPRLFERFHRIENTQGRTHEGSGIGLALINELVKLHGGSILVNSKLGSGTTFIITIPLGSDHLPKDQVQTKGCGDKTAVKTTPILEEVLRWLPDKQLNNALENVWFNDDSLPVSSRKKSARILVVDDNADMRHYLGRLLSDLYIVETIEDGEAALSAINSYLPDLIVTDTLMPRLDGFALLKELRANSHTANIPVIMLSARAGEESQVEGAEAGADDYLVKPFSGRILLAAISAHLQMASLRRETSKAVQKSEERFRALISATSDIVYRMNHDWTELQYLKGREFIVDILGPTQTWVDKYLHPDDHEQATQAIQHAIESKCAFELEHRLFRVDGSLGWAYSRVIPIIGKDDKIIEWLGTASDVTRRKEAEHALLEASRHKDEFLAMLAHELRNPLAPLCYGLQMMRIAKQNPASFDEILAMMERQLNQMVHLIDDLLDISRISYGKIELQKEYVELGSIVRQAFETNRPLTTEHEAELDLLDSPIYIHADVTRLAQVFTNLLNNAAKYTKKGGKIRISIQHQNGYALVSIRDNGIGIPPHMLPHVFEMFSQVDRHLDRSQGGLGIGLSVVKKLVELHQGSVEAKSEGEDLGSEFIVRLPIALSSAEVTNDPKDSPSIIGHRILVVDDNKDVATSLTMLLELMGNTIKTAFNGLEAIDIASTFHPEIILMDIGMPQLNGNETAKEIRKQPWGKNIILVALTGWGQDEDRRQSEAAGFNFHVIKPIELPALEKLLSEISVPEMIAID